MKKGLKERWIAVREDFSGKRLYLAGRDMYPRLYKTEKKAMQGCPDRTYCAKVLIPTKFKDENDE